MKVNTTAKNRIKWFPCENVGPTATRATGIHYTAENGFISSPVKAPVNECVTVVGFCAVQT